MYFLDELKKRITENGNATALTDQGGTRSVTYQELDALSDKIAGRLTAKGIGAGDAVILLLPRIAEYIASEIAVLRLGAVAVPLIPEYPSDRVDYIKEDSGAQFIIREDFFAGIAAETLPEVSPACAVKDDARGMIVYTSGSTGKPKGVVYTRSNLDAQIIRKLGSVKDISPLIFGAAATMSFCVAVTEYFRTLALGGHIHILSDEVRSDAQKLSDYYRKHQLTTGFISPRILKGFESKSSCLKRVFTAGEKVVDLYSPDFEIVNAYGQSETIGTITEFSIDQRYDNTPIGKPLAGIEILVADANGNPVEDGSEGELCFIGNLPCEYNHLKEQTDKVFKKLPDGRTFIRSGDIGKKLPDGNLLYLNRNDWMLKIHGQRVEPGEIESVMNSVSGITGSIVKAFENDDGTMLLCGFYTEKEPVDREDILKKLKKALPSYMVPSAFVKMEEFPVNANGKIARRAIERPDLSKLTVGYEKPVGESEEAICHAMEQILKIERIGRNDNFLQLGGNSLNAVELCSLCNLEGLSPQLVMLGQTPEKIARLIEENYFYPKPKLEIAKTTKGTYPMSLAQRYQLEFCTRYNVNIDIIDAPYFLKLPASIDQERLKRATEETLNEHLIYKTHFDVENELMLVDGQPVPVGEESLTVSEFEAFRHTVYTRRKDLKKDPLVEAKLLHIEDGSDYLFLLVCHLLYDGKSLSNLLGSISAKYNGTPEEPEQATIFDLIEYEEQLKNEKGLLSKASEVLEENYRGLTPHPFFEPSAKYETGVSKLILKEITHAKIGEFLQAYGISMLTLFQAAFERTVKDRFGARDFCYLNLYDGRVEEKLTASHGVFARPIFLRASIADNLKECFREIERQYQKLVYYDVRYPFDVVEQFPAINSGLLLNLRDLSGIFLKLGEHYLLSDFDEELNAAHKPFTDFDFQINQIPAESGFLITIASAKVSAAFADAFLECFENRVTDILRGNDVFS